MSIKTVKVKKKTHRRLTACKRRLHKTTLSKTISFLITFYEEKQAVVK